MLNLTIAMFKYRLLLIVLVFGMLVLPLPVLAEGQPRVDSPRAGDILQGQVRINGSTDLPGFRAYEVEFTYESAQIDSWFLIYQSDQPVRNYQLAVWDTTTIRDGDYRLRVRVRFESGETAQVVVSGLKVRNYSQVSADQPARQPEEPSAEIALAPTATLQPVSEPLPENPLAVSREMIRASMLAGVAAAVLILSGFGILLGLRRLRRRG